LINLKHVLKKICFDFIWLELKFTHKIKKRELKLDVHFPIWKGDIRAKHDLLNYLQVPGFYCCHFCDIKGKQTDGSGVVYFPKQQADRARERTHAEVILCQTDVNNCYSFLYVF
jgi:hypothetical protein